MFYYQNNKEMASRFKKLSKDIQKKGHYTKEEADAITASIGRKKYWKVKFKKMAMAWRKK